jgi:tetratricopeptide (TPR) repeat protein
MNMRVLEAREHHLALQVNNPSTRVDERANPSIGTDVNNPVTADCDRIGPAANAVDGIDVAILEDEIGRPPRIRVWRLPAHTGMETSEASDEAGSSNWFGQRRKELSLRLELAEALLLAAGTAPEPNIANLKRALEIANRLDEPKAAMTVLTSLVRVYWISPDLVEAAAYLDPLLALEARVDDRPLRAHAHANASTVAAMKGDLPRARRAAKVAWELIAEEEDPAIRFVTSDPGVQTLYSAALTEWLMGRPARAEALSRRGVERAPDPYRRVASLLFRGHLVALLRSIDEVDRVGRELERLQEEHGFGLPYAYDPAREGLLLWKRGNSDAAVARIQEGISLTRATGVGMHTTFLLATLAEVRLSRGEADEGLDAIEEAFAFAEKTGERYLEPELHRLRGELLLLEPRVEAATDAFERALAIARRHGARALSSCAPPRAAAAS